MRPIARLLENPFGNPNNGSKIISNNGIMQARAILSM